MRELGWDRKRERRLRTVDIVVGLAMPVVGEEGDVEAQMYYFRVLRMEKRLQQNMYPREQFIQVGDTEI